MARKKAIKKIPLKKYDPYDDLDDFYDDEIDIHELSRDFYSTERDDFYGGDPSITARRKIERRRDMKRLYSQLDEWEEFGESTNWD